MWRQGIPSACGAAKLCSHDAVTVTAVIMAPISLAREDAMLYGLAARCDPSIATRAFLNNVVLLLAPLSCLHGRQPPTWLRL
jgi:hypothetical protein